MLQPAAPLLQSHRGSADHGDQLQASPPNADLERGIVSPEVTWKCASRSAAAPEVEQAASSVSLDGNGLSNDIAPATNGASLDETSVAQGSATRRRVGTRDNQNEKNASSQGLGLSGYGAPPRRMTMRSELGAK